MVKILRTTQVTAKFCKYCGFHPWSKDHQCERKQKKHIFEKRTPTVASLAVDADMMDYNGCINDDQLNDYPTVIILTRLTSLIMKWTAMMRYQLTQLITSKKVNYLSEPI